MNRTDRVGDALAFLSLICLVFFRGVVKRLVKTGEALGRSAPPEPLTIQREREVVESRDVLPTKLMIAHPNANVKWHLGITSATLTKEKCYLSKRFSQGEVCLVVNAASI
jgi:hypothetical protein